MVSWRLAAGVAVVTHAVLLAVVSRLATPPVPLAMEEAGVPLVLQPVQPLATASLSALAGAAPRLNALAGMTIVTGRVAAAASIRQNAAAASNASAGRSGRAPLLAARGNALAEAAASGPVQEAFTPAPAKPGTAKKGADGAALLPGLEARIDEAVRQAATMPEAARRQHRQGRARVKFTYVDGRVNGVELVAPSQSRVLDGAALQAVSRAAYPPPPEALRGRHLDLLVWVNFRLDA